MPDQFVILPDDGPWRLARVCGDQSSISIIESDDDKGADAYAGKTYQAMTGFGYTGGPVLLAVPSHWCAAAPISTDALPRKDRHAAMAYRLEEKLPMAAEQFAAGFIINGAEALGICVKLDKARPIVEQLEAHGVFIHSVIPAAVLATQHSFRQDPTCTADIRIWTNGDWSDIFILDPKSRLPIAWSTLPNDPSGLTLQLNMLAIHGREQINVIVAGEEASEVKHAIADSPVVNDVIIHDEDMSTCATAGAELILNDRLEPWVDFNDVALGTTGRLQRILLPLKASMIAAVLMLICLNTAILWRAHNYKQIADRDISQQRTLFTDLFPNQKTPITIDKRLASEYKKISGTRGSSQALPLPPTTLTLLHHVLNRLPGDVRFRLIEIRIEDDSVYLDGQARSHGDVGSIARALGSNDATLIVETRHTEQLSNGSGVSFVIVASPATHNNQVTMR